MRKKHYTPDEVRAELHRRVAGRTQASIALAAGVKPQNLSVMLAGGPINGKVLEWLGFRRREVFEKVA